MHPITLHVCSGRINAMTLACHLHSGVGTCLDRHAMLVNNTVNSSKRVGSIQHSVTIDSCLKRHPAAEASATPITAACLLVFAEQLSVLTPFDVLRFCTQERSELSQHSHGRRAHLLYLRVFRRCRDRQKVEFDPQPGERGIVEYDLGHALANVAGCLHGPSQVSMCSCFYAM